MKYFKLLSVIVLLFGFKLMGSAQTLQDVAESLNKGVELRAARDFDAAIAEFERCIELAKIVGDEALEHQTSAEGVLPELYFAKVQGIPRTDFIAILEALVTAVEVAEKYNDQRTKENAERQIPQIYLAIGNTLRSEQKFEEAIENFDKAIAINPDFAQAYFLKGVCYESMRNEADMDENYRLAIEKGRTFGDAQNAQNAQQRLRNYYYNSGVSAQRAQKWEDAIAAFTKAVEVDENYFEAFLGLAMSFNARRSWDNAILNAEKALQIRETSDVVFWELGVAYKGKNDRAKACENFRKVTSGPRLENAKHEIEVVLKCN